GETIGDALLKPTKIYVKTILAAIERYRIKGIAHITGGGFIENIPRMLPKGLTAQIDKNSYPIPPVIQLVVDEANLDDLDAYNTFNMGIGMVLAVDYAEADDILAFINNETDDDAYIIGKVVSGAEGVVLK
ncbi:MAG: phosphoribosylformylglycinamidine cyclo-ligase, partial [Clostridiales bacterium]